MAWVSFTVENNRQAEKGVASALKVARKLGADNPTASVFGSIITVKNLDERTAGKIYGLTCQDPNFVEVNWGL